MAVNAKRSVAIVFSGDVTAGSTTHAEENAASPAQIESKTLSTGANTITPPASSKAVTIIMPSGNTVLLTLKGVTGDTGIPLHKTDPTTIGLDTTITTFVLNAASGVTVRLIWT